MAFDHDRIAQLFEKLDRQATKLSVKPQPKNIHQFRTAARRVETVLGELTPDQDRKGRKLLKLVSRLRRRAGRVRDLDVQIAALRNLKVSEQPGLKTQILQTLSEKRARREKRFLDMVDKATVRELRRRLKRALERFPDPAPDPSAVAQSMLAGFATPNGAITEKLLHSYRVQGKKIRYIAELVPDDAKAQRMVEELKRMQDALGEWHDWLTLNSTVEKLIPDGTNSPLRSAVSNIMRAKYRDAVQAVNFAKTQLLKKPTEPAQMASTGRRSVGTTVEAARAVA